MNIDDQLIYEAYHQDVILEEGLMDWFKGILVGTLLVFNTACSSINKADCPPPQVTQYEDERSSSPWFDKDHYWIGRNIQKLDYPDSLIKDIRAKVGEPPNPRSYQQDRVGELKWRADMKKYLGNIWQKFDIKEWQDKKYL